MRSPERKNQAQDSQNLTNRLNSSVTVCNIYIVLLILRAHPIPWYPGAIWDLFSSIRLVVSDSLGPHE